MRLFQAAKTEEKLKMSSHTNENELHVIFGTGPVGLAIMGELLRQGSKCIRMVNRSGKADLPAGVELLSGDATDPAFTRKASEGARVVYNALNPPEYGRWAELFPPLQVAVLEGAAAVGAKLVVMENIYMYGKTDGRPMTEALPYNPHSINGQVRAQMSRDLLAAHNAGKVRVAIGRASDFVGPRVLQSAMGERAIYPALAGKAASVLGNPDLPHTYTYMPDIGRALVILGEQDAALGQAWHIPSAQTLTTRQFINLIGQEIGQPVKVSAAPKLLLKAWGLFSPTMRAVSGSIYQFEQPFILDHSKFERAFGNQATPLNEVIRETVNWYRQHPQHSI